LNKVVIFAHKKYSPHLINLWLSHCSHLDYFKDCLYKLSGFIYREAYGGVIQTSSQI